MTCKVICANASAFQAVLVEFVDLAAVMVVYPEIWTIVITPSFVVDVKKWLHSRGLNIEHVSIFEFLKSF